MSQKLNIFLVFIQISTLLNLVYAQCNRCGRSGIACTSETDYAVCNKGEPSYNIVATCPPYTYCNLDLICANITDWSKPSCTSSCGVCTADLRFACVDTNKFQMCYGTKTPRSPVLTCPPDTVCDYYAKAGSFCGFKKYIPAPVCSGRYTPTTEANTEEPITQPATGTTLDRWATWCLNNDQEGLFPYISDADCKAYIRCYYNNNNVITGNYYTCPGSTIFNPISHKCVDPEEYECTA